MADNPEILDLNADIVKVYSGSVTRSEASGNLNLRRMRSRTNYNRFVNGLLTRDVVGEAPIPAYTSQDLQILTSSDKATIDKFVVIYGSGTRGNPASLYVTGGLFPESSSIFTYAQQSASVPSWTQVPIGKHHAFVITPLSSSDHEVSRLNAFSSGQLPLEQSAVPASATVYYSKATRLVYKVYKLSASIDLPVLPPDLEQFPFNQEITTPRPVFDATSGSYRAFSAYNPAVFEINIPDYGRIRDIRVWVEFIHDVRLGTGSIGSSGPNPDQGLHDVTVALRSPNVSFRAAHPLWNDPQTFGFSFNPTSNLTGALNQFGNFYNQVPEVFRSSYLLWAGADVISDDLASTFSGWKQAYPSWDNDIDMRTVFWDASPTPSPRHLDQLFPSATDSDPGLPAATGSAAAQLSGALSGGAPNNKAWTIASASIKDPQGQGPTAFGKNVPWILDPRINSGGISHSELLTNIIGLSPPNGWLTGPGETNAVGEFPTTGSNLGPDNIKPFYPLMDDVFVKRIYDQPGDAGKTQFVMPSPHPPVVGFRPGLRGSEVHGKWQLLIATKAAFDPFAGYQALPRSGIWFRQFRLEFILDQGPDLVDFYPSKSFRFKRPAYVPKRPGSRRIQIISGTASWDLGINYVQTEVREEYGRTSGITTDSPPLLTGVFGATRVAQADPNAFAIFSRITGSLADYLTGSVFTQGAFYTYLNNEFGTPFIPITSGSGITPSFETFDEQDAQATRDVIVNVIHPGPVIHQQDTITRYVARNNLVASRANVVNRIFNPVLSFIGRRIV